MAMNLDERVKRLEDDVLAILQSANYVVLPGLRNRLDKLEERVGALEQLLLKGNQQTAVSC